MNNTDTGPSLETDRTNAREYNEQALRAAWAYYLARLHDGYSERCSRCMAIAYLARKTRWSWPYAAGALDNHNTTEN